MFIGLILVGLLIYWFYMSQHRQQPSFFATENMPVNSGNALNILNERYARGEISDEEYMRIKVKLRND